MSAHSCVSSWMALLLLLIASRQRSDVVCCYSWTDHFKPPPKCMNLIRSWTDWDILYFFFFGFQYPAALMNLGAILHLNGKLQEAEANYLRALHLKPDDTITQSNLRKLWNIMEKQGLRTTSPWAQPCPPAYLPSARQTWGRGWPTRSTFTLVIQERWKRDSGRMFAQRGCNCAPPNNSWALHTPQASSFPLKHCSQFGRRYIGIWTL